MTVFVTGASGHIGANLVRELIKQGRKVKVLIHNDTSAIDGLPVEKIHGDLLDKDLLFSAIHGSDVVYHAAARISIIGDEGGLVNRTNVIGTRNIVEACITCKVKRMIHFSSIQALSVYPKNQLINENRDLALGQDVAAYDRSKALGIKEVLAGINKGLDAVIVYPTAVIGPYDYKPSRIGQALLDIYYCKLPALVTGGYNWVDARDVVQGAIAAEHQGKTGEKYILSGEWLSLCNLAKIVYEIKGMGHPPMLCPWWLARIGVPFFSIYYKLFNKSPLFTKDSLMFLKSHRFISHEKATKELGYNPRPLKETISDTLQWFQETESKIFTKN